MKKTLLILLIAITCHFVVLFLMPSFTFSTSRFKEQIQPSDKIVTEGNTGSIKKARTEFLSGQTTIPNLLLPEKIGQDISSDVVFTDKVSVNRPGLKMRPILEEEPAIKIGVSGSKGKERAILPLPSEILTKPGAYALTPALAPAPPESGILGLTLPLESRLEISGRKGVTLKYGQTNYSADRPTGGPGGAAPSSAAAPPVAGGFALEQELQVRLSGNVGKRVTVNVDYDDTKEQQRDIGVSYKGKEEELIQEAKFGDVTLTLPNTEFTGYNKEIFGAEIRAKYKKFGLTAIGAQTKGKAKTVAFKGGYTQVKTDIQDISYVKNKYYTIYMDSSHLPITAGSEQVWVDNQNGLDNNYPPFGRGTDPTLYTQKTSTAGLYSFNYFHPGTDYTIDYNTGTITFNKSISSNYVIVVGYKYAGGQVGYLSDGTFDFSDNITTHVIQKDTKDTSHQLQNYYYLGNKKILPKEYDPDFQLKISSLANNQEMDVANYPYTIDIDFGILKFYKNKPFDADDPDAYTINNIISKYKIHIEYKYKFRTYNLPDFNIVKKSEKVTMDGKLLMRDVDYTVDYESGFLLFFNEDKITDKTEITITYEYTPFGAGVQSNIFGIRGTYDFTENISFGSTYLYSGGQQPLEVPNIGATPTSLNIVDGDAKIKFDKDDIQTIFPLPDAIAPTELRFSGEIAKSTYNPNTYDPDNGEKAVAMVDSMEGTDNIVSMANADYSWFPASQPSGVGIERTNRTGQIYIYNEEDYGHDLSERAVRRQLFNIEYNFAYGTWDAIRYSISTSGQDYTRYKFLEVWMKADWNKSVDVNIDLGVISEDINGNSLLDTEDKNNDGSLNPGEDTGLNMNFAGEDKIVGANNNRFDTEDMDNNGKLDVTDSYYRYSFNTASINPKYIASDLGEWKLIKIPLSDGSATGAVLPSDRSLIKHIRLALKNENKLSGKVTIESIQVSGNKWELKDETKPERFNVRSISYDIDPNYQPLAGTGTFYRVETETERRREQSLDITYSNSDEQFYAYRTFMRPQSYVEYNSLRFDVFKRNTFAGDTIFVRLGADDNNYYQYEYSLDKVEADWQTVVLTLDGSSGIRKTVGTPYINNVMKISIGVLSGGSNGEIWVNNLRVTDMESMNGLARRVSGGISFGDVLSVDSNYRQVDSRFKLFEDSSTNQALASTQTYLSVRQTTRNLGITSAVKPIDFLPMTLGWGREQLLTDEPDKIDPNYFSYPDKLADNYNGTLGFLYLSPFNLNVDGNYKRESLYYLPQRPTTLDDTFNTSYGLAPKVTYALEFLGKNDFDAQFRYTEDASKHVEQKNRDTYSVSREQNYKYTGGYEPFSKLTFSPNYSYRFLDKRGNLYAYNPSLESSPFSENFEPQALDHGAGLTLIYSGIPGITPKGTFAGKVSRDFPRDELRPDSSLEGAGELRFAEWWNALEESSPTINYSHRVTGNAVYAEYTKPKDSKEPTTYEKLRFLDIWLAWPREDIAQIASQIITDSLNSRFKIFSKMTFTPRGSTSNERNMSAPQQVTKTNVVSAGSDFVLDEPPFFRSWLNPSAVNLGYDWKRIIRKDAKDAVSSVSYSNNGKFALPFKPYDNFNGTLGFTANFEDKEEGSNIFKNKNYTPSIEFYHTISFDHPLKLPKWF